MGRVNESNGYDKAKAKNSQFRDILSTNHPFLIQKWKAKKARRPNQERGWEHQRSREKVSYSLIRLSGS